ncbi:flavin-containing monooxygenase [Amycolatopsis azurea]|uniref:flavin-containing monooxygenase n=1 Tax=Amycolatopsis azurea TaxID=36819 RepID=UPI00380F8330
MSDHDAIIIGGGQAGLAAAHALRAKGLTPVILEAGPEPVGSWPRYYDSLTLFSPARYSSLPGLPFPGDPDHYPHRDDVVGYLRRYAGCLDTEIRTGHRVDTVTHTDGAFTVHAAGESALTAPILIAASGGFSRPYRPVLPGLDAFTGRVLHSSDYRRPDPFAGQRVLVVGAGNSAVQIASELAGNARVTLATRAPVKFAPQRPLGKDVHFWSAAVGFDHLPIADLDSLPIEHRTDLGHTLIRFVETVNLGTSTGTRVHSHTVVPSRGEFSPLMFLVALKRSDEARYALMFRLQVLHHDYSTAIGDWEHHTLGVMLTPPTMAGRLWDTSMTALRGE